MNVPIRESVGAALRFVRENWRLVLIVATLAAVGQGVIALLGANLMWVVSVLVAVLVAHTALVSRALDGPSPITQGLLGNSARVGGAMAMIGFFLATIFFVMTFFAMSALVAPFQNELKAAGENEAAVREVLDTAMASNSSVMGWTMLIGALLVFALTTRFYVVAPATIDRQRITVFESWRMTRGNFLRIGGARLLLLAPAFILVGALQSLIARLLGAPGGDPLALLAYSQANPVGFVSFYSISIFIQIAIVAALDAGLSASIYRNLKAPSPPPPAA
jgi:hypothetical protein